MESELLYDLMKEGEDWSREVEEEKPLPVPRPYPEEPALPEKPLPVPRPYPEEPALPEKPLPVPRPYPEEPVWRPTAARVRFLNAAYGFGPLRILVGRRGAVSRLGYGSVSGSLRVAPGYQLITVTGPGGYVYLQKSLPFQSGSQSTVAVIKTATGMDLLQLPDCGCKPYHGYGELRVSNLSYGAPPLDVLLSDGRLIYDDVHYKETTAFKRTRPGAYQLLFAHTDMAPMPLREDIETLESGYTASLPQMDVLASLYLEVNPGKSYTVVLLTAPDGSLQTVVLT